MNDIVLVISKHAMIDIEICLDRYSLTSAFVLTSAGLVCSGLMMCWCALSLPNQRECAETYKR